jgi:hypothetical protein
MLHMFTFPHELLYTGWYTENDDNFFGMSCIFVFCYPIYTTLYMLALLGELPYTGWYNETVTAPSGSVVPPFILDGRVVLLYFACSRIARKCFTLVGTVKQRVFVVWYFILFRYCLCFLLYFTYLRSDQERIFLIWRQIYIRFLLILHPYFSFMNVVEISYQRYNGPHTCMVRFTLT